MVNIFNEHRAFLEKLTSKEWLEARDKDKKAKMDGIKTDYLEDYKSDGLGKRAAEEKFQRLVASDKMYCLLITLVPNARCWSSTRTCTSPTRSNWRTTSSSWKRGVSS